MERSLAERCADTTAFRVLLWLAACAVLPVLGVGILVTAIGGPALVIAPQRIELAQVVFGVLALGGGLGLVGYVRALLGVRAPARHNVAATLLFVAAGVLAALGVAAYVAAALVEVVQLGSWSDAVPWLGLGGLFIAANLIWVLAGVASLQSLLRRYAEATGRLFDKLPVVLLCVAIALATTAALVTVTL
jgi:hypothetical protein